MTSAPIIARASRVAWILLVRIAMRDAALAFQRMIAFDASGGGAQDQTDDWIASVADALEASILAAHDVPGVPDPPASEHDIATLAPFRTPRVRLEASAFERGIENLRAKTVRAGGDVAAMRRRAEALAQEIATVTRSGSGYARRIARLRRMLDAIERSFWIKGAGVERVGRVREVIVRHMRAQGDKVPPEWSGVVARVQREIGGSTNMSDSIIRTQVVRAYNGAHAERLSEPRVKRSVPLVMLVEIHDLRTRGAPGGIYADGHARNPGFHHQAGGIIQSIDWFRQNNLVPPNGFRCFLPGTRISGDVLWASKALYSGPVVEIHTRNGAWLRVTGNHPVATTRGLVRAADINKGDDLFSDRRNIELISSGGSPENSAWAVGDDETPSAVEDVFQALGAHGRTSVQVSPLDLHGDAFFVEGKVDVVGVDWVLHQWHASEAMKLLKERTLSSTNSYLSREHALRASPPLVDRLCSNSGGLPRGSALSDYGSAALLDSNPFGSFRVGLRTDGDARFMESCENQLFVEPQTLRDFLRTESISIELDEAIHVNRYFFHGDVFDVETVRGFLYAGGILAGNCRGSLRGLPLAELDEMKLLLPDLTPDWEKINRMNAPKLAIIRRGLYPDPGFKRALLAVA